jgi:Protein of unknown function (DUF1552)
MKRLSRRMFLRSSATGAAFALPLLNDFHRPARAQTAPFKRLIVIHTPNGTVDQAWKGSGSGTSFQLSEITATAMAPHKNDIVTISGLDMSAALDGPGGDAHGLGIGCMLTGTELLAGDQFKAGMGGPGSGWPGGQSVDQYIAEKVGATTKFGSLDYSIKRAAGTIWTRMSYKKAGEPVTPYDDPQVAFDMVFGDVTTAGGSDAAAVARRQALRKSILDDVIGEFTSLSGSLSGADKRKVEAHLAAVRDIESRLTIMTPTPGTGTCVPGTRPTISASQEVKRSADGMEVMNAAADTDVPDRQIVWRKMLVAALACDLTRVSTFIMAPSRSDIFMKWLNIAGAATSHHAYSHQDSSYTSTSGKALIQINQWYAQQIANIIADMKATPEGTGPTKSMWDNTVLLWCNELGDGTSHSHTNVPVLLAGSAGGYIKTGQQLNVPGGTPYNSLLISLCNAMGLPDTTFGNPKHCSKGPLPGLKA